MFLDVIHQGNLFTRLYNIWRAENEARQCQIQDMVRKIDGNGTVYYEWAERLTKTRRGKKLFRPVTPRIYPNDLNPNRCVVSLLEEYLEKRRDNTEPSFSYQ